MNKDLQGREIKFRAWDKEKKIMYKDFWCHGFTSVNGLIGYWQKQHPVMQYTGLKDKNGKGIYEGDIINYEYNDYFHRKATIEFFDGGFITRYKGEPDRLDSGFSKHIEVIGNIYEHKELL